MTIAALRALIDAELPDVVRHPSPHWTGPLPERTNMTTPPTPPGPQLATIKDLLAWGDKHPTAALRRHAAQARVHLDALREGQRNAAEEARLDAEEAALKQHLEGVRAARAALRSGAPRTGLDYDAATIRAWAREQNIPCPGHGRLPQDIVAAWRETTGGNP